MRAGILAGCAAVCAGCGYIGWQLTGWAVAGWAVAAVSVAWFCWDFRSRERRPW